ncbi:MAG: phosphotransferase [Trebonia sp.]
MSDATHIRWAAERLSVPESSARKVWGGDRSTVYEIASWFLKIGDSLTPECERLQWARGRLPVPEVALFGTLDGKDALVTKAVPGTRLSTLMERRPAGDIVEMVATALRVFHATEAGDCPFKATITGDILVHGDACLPNIHFLDDGTLGGFVDLGEMGVGDIEADLAAAVWSLQYNLGPGHGLAFLRAYELTGVTGEDVDRLWHLYADGS